MNGQVAPSFAGIVNNRVVSLFRDERGCAPKRPIDFNLTPLDTEAIRYVCQGERGRGIAWNMGNTHETIRWRIQRMLTRLGLRNRTMIAVLAARNVWFPEDRHAVPNGERFKLSYQQRALLQLLCEGSSNAGIAFRLRISSETVKTKIETLRRRTHTRTRAMLAHVAIEQGWVK